MTPYTHPAAASSEFPRDAHKLEGGFATMLMHADEPDPLAEPNHPIAPALNLSSTYRTPHPSSRLAAFAEEEFGSYQRPAGHIYSRYTAETRGRAEEVLGKLMGNVQAVTYASGLNAAYAVALLYQPTTIAIRRGYFGCHESFQVYAKTKGNVRFIDLDDEYPSDGSSLLVWLETPLNPSGEARDIARYADKTHALKNAVLAVDSTFAPPPLQNPFDQGADCVMHSATKYLGGHSDLLMGVVAVKHPRVAAQLWHDRTYVGSAPGNMESYLLLRSLRSLEVRVTRQSETAVKLAQWLWTLCPQNKDVDTSSLSSADVALRSSGIVGWVSHSSLQPRSASQQDPNTAKPPEGIDFDPSESQMPGGHSPTFAIRLDSPRYKGGPRAAWLPHSCQFWIPATSLGGVESLIEHRISAEPSEDPGTVRLSCGLENWEDLRDDLRLALKSVLDQEAKVGELPWQGAKKWEAYVKSKQQPPGKEI